MIACQNHFALSTGMLARAIAVSVIITVSVAAYTVVTAIDAAHAVTRWSLLALRRLQ
jgi:hypothetical protein